MGGYTLFLAVLFFGLGLQAQEIPDPQALLAASKAAYQALESYAGKMIVTFETLEFSFSLAAKFFFSYPFSRVEYEHEEEISFLPQPALEIFDHEKGRVFVLYTNEEWEEIYDESVREPWFPGEVLGTTRFFPFFFELEGVEEGELAGKPAWIVVGRVQLLEKGEVRFWLDKNTLFLRRIEAKGPDFSVILVVEEFAPGAGLSPDFFQPPAPELITRQITIFPQGEKILLSAWQKLADVQTFVVHKRVTRGAFRQEEVVTYRHPFLRCETRAPVGPFLPAEPRHIIIYDFASGLIYFYDPFEDSWEKDELFTEVSPEVTRSFALMEAFRISPPQPRSVVGLKEELLRGRKTWRIKARKIPGTDGPGFEWWVDQETFVVLKYAEWIEIPKRGEKEVRREVVYADILGFEVDVEIPDELFAVPADVPLRRFELPEDEELLEELKGVEAELEGWEAFSFARLEEAKAQGKTVVLYFSAEWCEPCHALEAGPLRNPQVQALLAPLVRLAVDLSYLRGEAKKVADLYRVKGVPTLLFLDSQGNELGRITGYRGTSSLLREIQRILEGGGK